MKIIGGSSKYFQLIFHTLIGNLTLWIRKKPRQPAGRIAISGHPSQWSAFGKTVCTSQS